MDLIVVGSDYNQRFLFGVRQPPKTPAYVLHYSSFTPPLQVTDCTLFSTTSPHAKFPET